MTSISEAIQHGHRRDRPILHLPPDPAETQEYRTAMAQAVEARERAERIIRTLQHQYTGPVPSRAPTVPERS